MNLTLQEGEFAVKRKRFSLEQIVAVLKQAELGMAVGTSFAKSASRSKRSIAGRSSMRGCNRIKSASRSSQEENARLK